MKAVDLLELLGEADERLIAEAGTVQRRKWNLIVKWAAAAACLCLIAVSAIMLPGRMSKKHPQDLTSRLADMGIQAERVEEPHFTAENEMPMITQEDLRNAISRNLTIQGSLSSVESVRIEDTDAVWYITTAEITADEVLNGEPDADPVRIVCAACYSGLHPDEHTVPIGRLTGCREGMNGVFVLREVGDEPWTVCGTEVLPNSLGDYYVVYCLERSGDLLSFPDQNFSVSVHEIGK